MKKIIYLILFTFLGFLLQLLIHSLLEVFYIGKLVTDFQKYSLGQTWAWWYSFHIYATVVLSLVGLIFGWWQGRFWWRKVYEKRESEHDIDHNFY